MSGSNPCTCEGTLKERRKKWVVSRRNYNNSAFESPKGAMHYSKYSSIQCNGNGGVSRNYKGCLMVRRSKEKFVDSLPDA